MCFRILGRRWVVGVDFGQRRDYTALVVVEDVVGTEGRRDAVTWAPLVERKRMVRHAERVALGTEYGRVVQRVREVGERLKGEGGEVMVVADGTGVGVAVVEMLRKEVAGRGMGVEEVVMTGGERGSYRGGASCVPKKELLDGLALAMEGGKVKLAAGRGMVKEMVEEMRGMKREAGWRGKVKWVSVGRHDDLVMALGLAVWGTERRPMAEKWERLGWGAPWWEGGRRG